MSDHPVRAKEMDAQIGKTFWHTQLLLLWFVGCM